MHPFVQNIPACRDRSLFDILYTQEVVVEPFGAIRDESEVVAPLTPSAKFERLLKTLSDPAEGGIGWEATEEEELRQAWKSRALPLVSYVNPEGIPATTGEAVRQLSSAALEILADTIPYYYISDPRLYLTTNDAKPSGSSRRPGKIRVLVPLSESEVPYQSTATPAELIGREELRADIRKAYSDAARLLYCADLVAARVGSYQANKTLAATPDPTGLSDPGSPPPVVSVPALDPRTLGTGRIAPPRPTPPLEGSTSQLRPPAPGLPDPGLPPLDGTETSETGTGDKKASGGGGLGTILFGTFALLGVGYFFQKRRR